MSSINSLKDLVIGSEYYLFWGSNIYWKIVFLGIINANNHHSELLVSQIVRGKSNGTNVPYAYEIGIGISKKEAKSNYAKFIYEDLPNAYKNRQDASVNEHFLLPF